LQANFFDIVGKCYDIFVCHDGLSVLQMQHIVSVLQCSLKVGESVAVCVLQCVAVCNDMFICHDGLSFAADATPCDPVAVILGDV